MAQQTINVGTAPNDGTGTPLRTAFQYTNSNFTELYTAVGPSGNNIVVPGAATITGNLTVDTNTLFVDASNNRVGNGTATPAYPLDVVGVINTNSEIYATGGRLALYRTAGASYVDYASGQDLVFRTVTSVGGGGPSELMRLNSTGLGVGVSPANDKLLVASTSGIIVTGTTADLNFRNSAGTAIQRLRYTDTDGSLTIGSATGVTYPVILGGNTTTRAVTIDASSNVGIGVTPSAGKGCLQLSSGINFPATQVASTDANTLDDYEEGTFTPTIVGTTSAGTGTYTTQLGNYTKVGRIVTCDISLVWTAHTGTGNIDIGGLPFSVLTTSGYAASAVIGYIDNIALTAGNIPIAVLWWFNTTKIRLNQTPTGGGAAAGVPMDTAGQINLSITYIVA